MRWFGRIVPVVFFAAAGCGQTMEVFSELQRIDPFGEVLALDRAEDPREILSPAAPRGGYTSLQLVVRPRLGEYFHLYIAQNPEDFSTVSLYREEFTQVEGHWVPDRLEPVEIPYTAQIPKTGNRIEGQSAMVFWLDIHVAANAPSHRFRVEAQLNDGGQWLVAPFEVRVFPADARAPVKETPLPVAGLTARADENALAVLRAGNCPQAGAATYDSAFNLRWLIARNAAQDLSLAKPASAGAVFERAAAAAGFSNPGDLCANAPKSPETGAEWYLKVRDALLKGAREFRENP